MYYKVFTTILTILTLIIVFFFSVLDAYPTSQLTLTIEKKDVIVDELISIPRFKLREKQILTENGIIEYSTGKT